MSSCPISVSIYEETLKPHTNSIINSGKPLEELIAKANALIHEKFASDPRRLFTRKSSDGSSQLSVELDKVMIAMLTYAEECGGQHGKRYVAAAIVACSEEEDAIQALVALGTTWLTHLLFVFKIYQPTLSPSQISTPTFDETLRHLSEGANNGKIFFADYVKRRDVYACVVTGFEDYSHPNPSPDTYRTVLQATQILPRVIGEFDSGDESNSFRSALTTFDILINFARLSVKTLEEFRNELDSPSNGLTLESHAHYAFDRYLWCLQPTEVR
ncbi:hypothetical protein BJ165DRAFT_1377061, partial [Panaeolus papilionaceus]